MTTTPAQPVELIDTMHRFNRSERYHVVNRIFGGMTPHPDFISEVDKTFNKNLSGQERFLFLEYPISWFIGSLIYTLSNGNSIGPFNNMRDIITTNNNKTLKVDLMSGRGALKQDFDAIIVFRKEIPENEKCINDNSSIIDKNILPILKPVLLFDDSSINSDNYIIKCANNILSFKYSYTIIFIEAKYDGSWDWKQYLRKIRRLQFIFGDKGNEIPFITPLFLAMSSPTRHIFLEYNQFPSWVYESNNKPYFININLPNNNIINTISKGHSYNNNHLIITGCKNNQWKIL